jgi:hypothetical protein
MSNQKTSAAILSQRTLIPASMIIAVAPLFWWLTSVAHSASQNEKDIAEIAASNVEFQRGLASKLDDQGRMLSGLQADVAAIDAKAAILVDYVRERRPLKRGQ